MRTKPAKSERNVNMATPNVRTALQTMDFSPNRVPHDGARVAYRSVFLMKDARYALYGICRRWAGKVGRPPAEPATLATKECKIEQRKCQNEQYQQPAQD